MGKNTLQETIDEIHEQAITIDAHFDLLFDVAAQRALGRTKVIETDHLPEFIKGGWNVIVSSIYLEDADLPENALRKALHQVSCLYTELEESADKLMLCKDTTDILQAKASGKVGIMLSFEGVEPLGTDISLLRVFYELGVRFVGLTWSRRNAAGDGCTFKFSDRQMTGGLSDFGLEVLREAEKLGMIMDVTHINDEGFEDIMAHSNQPVIASHSNARAVSNTPRNLTDAQLQALADSGGVAGINAVSIIASVESDKPDVNTLADHIGHMAGIVGVEHIGLGLDLCDLFTKYKPDGVVREAFDIVDKHGSLGRLTFALLERGFAKEDIIKIYGRNFMKVYERVLG
ncbi:membrane dipeptidase [Virgibacillus sp. YIM 98842]|uniref:dipeptidase n=1 Tax=Virgibacillus sp. YIM 98842 TaxID=2663533 RepID=UPI001969F41D|nr:membrane dipeptidase [Virgibacillus sp. YIM 98842]